MKENFETSLKFVLTWEGGDKYTEDPKDPGGATKFGISQKAYPGLNIKDLTLEQAKAIYKKDYWDKCGCDVIGTPMDIITFDTAVNMGITTALRFKEKATDWQDYLMLRIAKYNDINNPKFLRGWLNRVLNLYKTVKRG